MDTGKIDRYRQIDGQIDKIRLDQIRQIDLQIQIQIQIDRDGWIDGWMDGWIDRKKDRQIRQIDRLVIQLVS